MKNEIIIETQDLCMLYKGATEPTIKNISLSIKRNEIFGLLGPNGAGKTTTISLLCGLFTPSSGETIIDGYDFKNNAMLLKGMIGVVPQDIALYSTLTAFENLEFFGTMYGLSGKVLKDKINFWLERLGLTASANRRVSTYSGGMKRRVNLIAALLHSPKILFLDEPTVGVDVQSRNVIIEQLQEINKTGTTIIYTSHHMDEAEHFCTHVAIIDDGRIITEGSPKELIKEHEGCTNLESVFLKLTNKTLRD